MESPYNALEYVYWRGDLNFTQSEVNEVDAFLFTQLANPEYERIFPKKMHEVTIEKAAREYFNENSTKGENLLLNSHCLTTFKVMGESERYKNAILCEYETKLDFEDEEQFSAVTIRLKDDLLVVSFRGTDDTLIGWKEDCYLAVYNEVPAQRDAVKYLEYVAKNHKGRIVTVGHSKGGNLAVYAAAKCSKSIRKRILYAISFDGPGFRKEFFETKGYQEIKDRTYTTLSQNAIVGMLLDPAGIRHIVHTDTTGFMAHDGFTWYVKGNHFKDEKEFSYFSKQFEKIMNRTLAKLKDEEKKEFVDELFNALESTGAKTLTEIKDTNIREAFFAVKAITKSVAVRGFASAVKNSIREGWKGLKS